MKVMNRRTTLGPAGAVVAQAIVPGAMAQPGPASQSASAVRESRNRPWSGPVTSS